MRQNPPNARLNSNPNPKNNKYWNFLIVLVKVVLPISQLDNADLKQSLSLNSRNATLNVVDHKNSMLQNAMRIMKIEHKECKN